MNQSRVEHFAEIRCGTELADCTVGQLASLARPNHPLMELVDTQCSAGCGEHLLAHKFFAAVTCCDACRKKHDDEEALARVKRHWERICPKGFRDTDKSHAGFPRLQYQQLADWTGTQSLFLYGPTGKGKTRLGMLMLKRAMMKNHWVGVLWPDKLRSLITGYDSTTFDLYASFDVLLMDDPLLTACRESRLVDAVKNLVDVRMRHERATIYTSQIGTEDEVGEGKEFGDAKVADKERIRALLRRLKETCQVVSFAPVQANQGESQF